jgi:hypothetical protein
MPIDTMTDKPIAAERALILERLNQALHDVYKRHLKPAWIILGQEEWYDLKASVPPMERLSLVGFSAESIPEYRGVRIVTVAVAHHFEVMPELPR